MLEGSTSDADMPKELLHFDPIEWTLMITVLRCHENDEVLSHYKLIYFSSTHSHALLSVFQRWESLIKSSAGMSLAPSVITVYSTQDGIDFFLVLWQILASGHFLRSFLAVCRLPVAIWTRA